MIPPTKKEFVATLCIYTAGGLFWAFLPLFVGIQIHSGGLTEVQAGALGSAYLAGFTLISLSGIWWVSKVNWRYQTFAASGIIIACLWLISVADQYFYRLGAVFIVGLMMGSFWTIAYCIFAATANPDRSFAIGIVISYTVLAGVSYGLGHHVIPAYGFKGSVAILSSILVLLAVSSFFLPEGVSEDQKDNRNTFGRAMPLPIAVALFGLMATGLAFAAVWTFAERIGVNAGLENQQISSIIAGNLLASAAGSLLASVLGTRLGRAFPLMVGILLLLLSVLLLTQATVFWFYGLAISGLGFFVGFVLPYQMGAIGEADSKGRFVVLIGAAQGFGSAAGAYFGGLAFNLGGAFLLSIMAATSLAFSAIAFALLITRRNIL